MHIFTKGLIVLLHLGRAFERRRAITKDPSISTFLSACYQKSCNVSVKPIVQQIKFTKERNAEHFFGVGVGVGVGLRFHHIKPIW